MKQTINFSMFCDAFAAAGRNNQFSYNGLVALFDYLEQYEDETGTELELDVVSLCCDFTEYKNLDEFQADYGEDYETMEAVEDETAVIYIFGGEGFIIQAF